jgi:hypothetical protein
MRNLWKSVSKFLTFNSTSLKYKLVDKPLYRKKNNKKHNIRFTTKSKHTTDYLDEDTDEEDIQKRNTDEEDIQKRNIDKLFVSSYEKEYYFEVVVPEIARRAAEAADDNDSYDDTDSNVDTTACGF